MTPWPPTTRWRAGCSWPTPKRTRSASPRPTSTSARCATPRSSTGCWAARSTGCPGTRPSPASASPRTTCSTSRTPPDPSPFRTKERPMSDQLGDTLRSILEEDLDLPMGEVTRESLLIEDLGLDSVAFAIGVVAIEERLGVALTEREMSQTSSVGELEDLIRSKASAVAR
ncbi:acyl carrier protein [Nocardia takedensis]|uniref:acyl carrier protein n=1 Tax=Nocardia takedensis TaxID=259390 RepID=UPI00278BEF73|nr:acyl carrier protein [Nocardia takedensis]